MVLFACYLVYFVKGNHTEVNAQLLLHGYEMRIMENLGHSFERGGGVKKEGMPSKIQSSKVYSIYSETN